MSEEKGVARAFGDRLSLLRAEAGLTIDQMAERSSLHRSEITNLEKGKHSPRLDTVAKLAGALEKDLCELLVDIPRWEPPTSSPGSFG